jgi:phosphate starvation-inducible PhoH-like protein
VINNNSKEVNMKRAQRNRCKSSSEKEELHIKDKFLAERELKLAQKPLVAMNERQAEYIQAILDYDLVISTGYAGTSKTFIPATMAADALRKGEAKKVYLCRPNVSESQSLGFFSGDVDEKLFNWLMPIISVMKARMGATEFDIALKEKNIELLPLETIKGMSFGKGCWVLIDEAEDLTIREIKCIATRAGGAKMIMSGDTSQSVFDENSGLSIFYNIVQRSPRLQESVYHICFDEYNHIVRSKLCKDLIIEFDRAGY